MTSDNLAWIALFAGIGGSLGVFLLVVEAKTAGVRGPRIWRYLDVVSACCYVLMGLLLAAAIVVLTGS